MAGERTLPGLGLTAYWTVGSNNWEAQHDPDTRMLSVLCQAAVISRVTNLPGSPANGDIYIVPVGQPNADSIAARDNGAWVYYTPKEGWLVYVKDEDTLYLWNGTAWGEFQTGSQYPALTGNGGRVLAVNAAETDAEWRPVYSNSGGSTNPASAKWRILINSNAGDANVCLTELEFRGAAGGPNLAVPGGTFGSSGMYSAGSESKWVDGDTATNYWLNGNTNVWWSYEFASPVSINEIVLYSQNGQPNAWPTNITMQYWDGATWQDAWTTATGLTAGYQSVTLTDPTYIAPTSAPILPDINGNANKVLAVKANELDVEWVTPSGGGGSSALTVATKTADYTLVLADAAAYVRMDVATANTLTVPANSTVAFPVGTVVQLRQVGAGQTTIAAGAGVTINTSETLKLRKAGASGALVKVATDEWDLTGDLEAAP